VEPEDFYAAPYLSLWGDTAMVAFINEDNNLVRAGKDVFTSGPAKIKGRVGGIMEIHISKLPPDMKTIHIFVPQPKFARATPPPLGPRSTP